MNYAAILLLTHIVLIGLGIRKWIKEDLSYVKPLARSWCQQLRVCRTVGRSSQCSMSQMTTTMTWIPSRKSAARRSSRSCC